MNFKVQTHHMGKHTLIISFTPSMILLHFILGHKCKLLAILTLDVHEMWQGHAICTMSTSHLHHGLNVQAFQKHNIFNQSVL